MWAVLVDRSPDPSETTLVGMFVDEASAWAFIEEAHDPDNDPACENGCFHIWPDDVDYARPVFVNIMKENI